MHVASRSLPADVVTPISAYIALARPGQSCLLESAETGDRISRYSFLGLDYEKEATFAGNRAPYGAIRAFVEPFATRSREAGFPGAALVAFSYDAARATAGLTPREAASPSMPAAYVAVPRTWLVFDHYTDTLTIWSCDDAAAVLRERLDRYEAQLLAATPKPIGRCRASAPLQSIEKDDYLRLVGSVQVTDVMTIERYSHVMHITSNVSGHLAPGRSAFDALQVCLPAGTVSGAPKVRAMEIIDELEPCRRGPYGGAVGYVDFAGNMDTCIALRTIVIHDEKAYVQAGAGIVADSVPENEWNETLNKARGLLKAIELAAVGSGQSAAGSGP